MRKFLLRDLKKNWWLLLILTAVCVLPYVATTSTSPMTMEWWVGEGEPMKQMPASPNLWMVGMQLIMLTFIAPVAVFSFKMNKRSVDCFYAMPIKRWKLFLAKCLLGLVLVLLPFTLSYWSGFFALLIRKGNPYEMLWYLPAYFALLLYGVCLFGWHSFLYTRANKPFDGLVFLFAYIFVGAMLATSVLGGLGLDGAYDYVVMESIQDYIGFGGVISFYGNMEHLITGDSVELWTVESFLIPALLGVAGYLLLFALLPLQKAEDAEQVSNDWFGYKILIPLYTAYCLGMSIYIQSVVLGCVVVAFTFVGCVVWRRKFRIGKIGWIVLGAGLLVGVILGILFLYNMP